MDEAADQRKSRQRSKFLWCKKSCHGHARQRR
jgi:hypothetical protein